EIAAGDVVTTLAESRLRLALKDGSQLTLGELTKVTVAQFDFAEETLAREAAFDLTSGFLEAITAKAATGSSFVIRTSNAVAATRATEWIVGKISLGPTAGPKASDAKKLAALKAGLALELE
ncbi:MAG: FecR domain-containing protein, partial [Rhodospirillaceae bacterium]|nr:FecR domain-containing protein [Rhodospirillaceae bacterium]